MNEAFDSEPVIRSFVSRSRQILGETLTGIYLHGSAAMGCYNPAKSDLDFLTVTERPLSDACKRAYMDMVVALDADVPGKGIEMSIVLRSACTPFVYPTPFELHFSRHHLHWYRGNPGDYIQKMKGTDKDLAAHCMFIQKRGRCLYGLPIEAAFSEVPAKDYMDSLWNDISGAKEEMPENTMYLTLNLARVIAYQQEGLVLSKKEGGEWGLQKLPEAFRPVIRAALREYTENEGHYDMPLAQSFAEYALAAISAART